MWLVDDLEASAARRAAVGVDRDRRVGVRTVADSGALVDAGADAFVRGAREDDTRAFTAQDPRQPRCDVEGVGRLAVAVVRRRAGRVAGLTEAARVDETVDLGRMRPVGAVVARVDGNRLAEQRQPAEGLVSVVADPVLQRGERAVAATAAHVDRVGEDARVRVRGVLVVGDEAAVGRPARRLVGTVGCAGEQPARRAVARKQPDRALGGVEPALLAVRRPRRRDPLAVGRASSREPAVARVVRDVHRTPRRRPDKVDVLARADVAVEAGGDDEAVAAALHEVRPAEDLRFDEDRLAAVRVPSPERHPVGPDRARSARIRLVQQPASVGRVASVHARSAAEERGSHGCDEERAHRVHVYARRSSLSQSSRSPVAAAARRPRRSAPPTA